MKFYRLMLWLMIILVFGLIDMAYAAESAKKDKSKTDATTTTTTTTTTDATAADTAAASKDAEVVTAPVQKEVQGEISDIGKDYISIVYNQDTEKGIEYEMRLPIDENIKFEHRKNLKEFVVGDIIKVEFEDAAQAEAGKVKLKRKVKVVSFVGPSAKKSLVSAPPESGGQ